jgi:hypothetical protein
MVRFAGEVAVYNFCDQRLRGGDVVVESRIAGPHDVSDDP